jgi:hypothetical protein
MTEKLGSMVQGLLALGCLAASLVLTSPASAENAMAGVYQGFLAFDYKGEEVREWMMISFHEDGTLIMGAEEGHDEPVDPDTGLATRNDVESANLGLWRMSGENALEFGSQQYRAGSGFCAPVNKHGDDLLPTCSFILTARLQMDVEVRGEKCDLGGVGGGFSIQSVDRTVTEANPPRSFGLGLKIDYCLQRLTVDKFLELAPIK